MDSPELSDVIEALRQRHQNTFQGCGSDKALARVRGVKALLSSANDSRAHRSDVALRITGALATVLPQINDKPLTLDAFYENHEPDHVDGVAYALYHDLVRILRMVLTSDASKDLHSDAVPVALMLEPTTRMLEIAATLGELDLLVGVGSTSESWAARYPYDLILDGLRPEDLEGSPALAAALERIVAVVRAAEMRPEAYGLGYFDWHADVELRARELLGDYDVHAEMARHFAWFESPGPLLEVAPDRYPIYQNDPFVEEHRQLVEIWRSQPKPKGYKRESVIVSGLAQVKAACGAAPAQRGALMMAALCRVLWACKEPRATPRRLGRLVADPLSLCSINAHLLVLLLRRKLALDEETATVLAEVFAEIGLCSSTFSAKAIRKQLDGFIKAHGATERLELALERLPAS